MFSIKLSKITWKFSMGTKGINVKNTMIIGNMARKKLNEIDDALEVTDPLNNPRKKNMATL